MTPHLSPLVVDELAAGLPGERQAQEHLQACAECRQAVEAATQRARALLATPEAQRRLEVLLAGAPGQTRKTASRSRLRWLMAAAIPLAAALVLFVLPTSPPERVKGAATIELLDATGAAVSTVHAGQTVRLAAGHAGHPFGVVLAVEADGHVTQLWPTSGPDTAAVGGGARVVLLERVEVTPGSFTLHAFFTDAPAPVRTFADELRALVDAAKAARTSPLEVRPTAPGATARATQRIEVAP